MEKKKNLKGNDNKKLKHKMTLFDCPYYCHPKHVWIIKMNKKIAVTSHFLLNR